MGYAYSKDDLVICLGDFNRYMCTNVQCIQNGECIDGVYGWYGASQRNLEEECY